MSLQKDDDPLKWRFSRGPIKGDLMFNVDPDSGCWIWQGTRDRGYGRIQIAARHFPGIRMGSKAKSCDGWLQLYVHQLTYFMKHGNPPRGKELDHTCIRRCCGNWDHVVPKTPKENKAVRYQIPDLTDLEVDLIAEAILDRKPNNWIAQNLGFSIWAVRRVADRIASGMQLNLPVEETPF